MENSYYLQVGSRDICMLMKLWWWWCPSQVRSLYRRILVMLRGMREYSKQYGSQPYPIYQMSSYSRDMERDLMLMKWLVSWNFSDRDNENGVRRWKINYCWTRWSEYRNLFLTNEGQFNAKLLMCRFWSGRRWIFSCIRSEDVTEIQRRSDGLPQTDCC